MVMGSSFGELTLIFIFLGIFGFDLNMKGLGRSPSGKATERWLERSHNGVVNDNKLYSISKFRFKVLA